MSNNELSRLTFNLPTQLLKDIDAYAEKMSVNRTSAMCFLMSQALENSKAINELSELLRLYQSEHEDS